MAGVRTTTFTVKPLTKKRGNSTVMRDWEQKLGLDWKHVKKVKEQRVCAQWLLLFKVHIALEIHERLYLQHKVGSRVVFEED